MINSHGEEGLEMDIKDFFTWHRDVNYIGIYIYVCRLRLEYCSQYVDAQRRQTR